MANTSMKDILKTLQVSFEQSNYKNGINLILEKKDTIPKDVFHFYLGNLYLKQGDLGAGRYNLEKAKKLGYQHQILENNIKFVESKVEEYGTYKSDDYFSNIIDKVSTAPVQVELIITTSLILLILLAKRAKKISSNVIFTTLLLFALIPLGFKGYVMKGLSEAIVLKETKLYDGPSKIFRDIRDVPPGVKLILSTKNEEWFFVEHPRHLNGWVRKSDLGLY